MSADNMRVLGNLTIREGTTLSNSLHNKNIYILGDWVSENSGANDLTGPNFIRIDGKQ